ncbi:MAG: DUF3703 domain-containing protein [Saprospiraceae bacterium]|nr:DUF3703 domain-containing protein [Saprospiraceae bacterium]
MKIYWVMPQGIKEHYRRELDLYKTELVQQNLPQAWHHLERAHILAQAWPCEHSYVHWRMLLFGIHIKSLREILGQIPRLLVGGVKSFVGNIPVGNTGGANVPPLQPMETPEDLETILGAYKRNS